MKKCTRLLILLSTLLLVGCNSNQQKTPNDNQENTKTETETTKTTEKKAEDAKLAPYFQDSDITYSEPKNIDILSQAEKDSILAIYNKNIDPQYAAKWSEIEFMFAFKDVGEINNGKYKSQKLVLGIQNCDGPCFKEEIYRYAYDPENKKLTLLIKHSSEEKSEFFETFADKTDTTTKLKGLDLPEKIKIAGTGQYVEMDEKDAMQSLDEEYYNNAAFSDPELGEILYQYSKEVESAGAEEAYRKQGCLFIRAGDGTVSQYSYNSNFFKGKEKAWINWENGDKATNLTDNYVYEDTPCGFGGMCYLITIADEKNLTLSGKTTTDIEIYEDKNPASNEEVKTFYENYRNNQEILKSDGESFKELTLEEFTKTRPILYWKDALGRWARLINKDAKAPAECGKPVIYLYPQQTTDVNVKVGIEKLTETIPAYSRNGWTVSANPDGKLYNYADGQNYPYLFWEGQGEGTNSPDKGFVVARNDVENFLEKSLSKLGLNSKERADFKEFWIARILDNHEPYFFFSFMGTSDFNKIAPLSIAPTPDTLIRIFMYYKPLDNKIETQPQTLRAAKRRGFTVVEWGGTSTVQWEK